MGLKIQPLLELALGGLGSALTTGIEAKTAKENTDKTNQANRELAEYSYSKDLEMWNRGNVYNSPTAQMERLKTAGLNPNLVYGNGAVGNTAGNLPKYNAPTMNYSYRPPVDPLAMIGAYQNFKIQNAQYDNLKAQNDVIKQEGISKRISNEYLGTSLFRSNVMKGQKIDKDATTLGWLLRGGEEGSMNNSNAWKGLNADLSFRQGRVRQQEEAIRYLGLGSTLRGQESEFFNWGQWSRLLQGFGLKLPSFRK
ncbi:MAG: DNA pilot protein [Microvirus sp.]|nr:MAG: DNA pilot protein [Microvirus sp.]